MPSPVNATVHIVDDDASVREGMAWLLRTHTLAQLALMLLYLLAYLWLYRRLVRFGLSR